ncbi:NAD(P)-binding protein [Penicillium alfredii]|uniref:NAD(P)-binding protein n=1 Tax=Penicillium alfredii TaxID=1506179 RepID=A0A9W9F1G9_9EURO|nr:NAD(P)-binding protein [Penicillium alfredii]KAJ5091842.1 NAD(P)-binding protein [Penicillium alfredii]
MPRIRTALIGLSSSAKTSWAEHGHLPYLLSPRGQSHYEIVALLNSTAASAQAAKHEFGLPATVKAYGDAASLAADPDIDLVVCCTRVDIHYDNTEPSLKAGKAVYIEWPIAENFARAAALMEGKQWRNSIAGLQGRLSPVAFRVKTLLQSGEIGKILSSDIHAFADLLKRDSLPEGLAYFARREVGGNPVTIAYAHMIDYVHTVLGEFEAFDSRMQIQRPALRLLGKEKDGLPSQVVSDVPDLVVVHGRLAPGIQDLAENATLSVTFRTGQPFKDSPAFVWTINGETGEIRITSPSWSYLQSDAYVDPIRIELHRYGEDAVENIHWDWEEWQKEELPKRARLVGAVYERYAAWVEGGRVSPVSDDAYWPRIHDGLRRHEEIETLFEQFDAQQLV